MLLALLIDWNQFNVGVTFKLTMLEHNFAVKPELDNIFGKN